MQSLDYSKIRLFAVLSVFIALPALGFSWIANQFLVENIKTETIKTVGRTAHFKHEQLTLFLSQANSRVNLLLANMLTQCNGSPHLNKPCADAMMHGFIENENALGAVLHQQGMPDSVIGVTDLQIEKQTDSKPGQISQFANYLPGLPRSYFIHASDSKSGLNLIIEYPNRLIQELFQPHADLGKSGETFLVDEHGLFITQSKYPSTQGHSHPISAGPMKRCLAMENAETLDLDYRDTPVIHGFRFVPEIGGGCIMAHIDQAEAFAALTELKHRILMTAIAFIGFAVIAGAYASKKLIKPYAGPTQSPGQDKGQNAKFDADLYDKNRNYSENADRIRTLAFSIVLMDLAILYGWANDITWLKSVLPSLISIKPNTAASLMAYGLCLLMLTFPKPPRLLIWLCALPPMLFSVITLCEYIFDWDAGIDQIGSPKSMDAESALTPNPGRMSVSTAANFIFIGFALLLMDLRQKWPLIQLMALTSGLSALLPIGSLMFGELAFTLMDSDTSMALYTALNFLILAIAILLATSKHGFIARLQKWIMPLSLAIPLGLLIVASIALLHGAEQHKTAMHSVEHAYQVILKLGQIKALTYGHKAHIRAYLLTKDEAFIEKASLVREDIYAYLRETHQLIDDNAAQKQRLTDLEQKMHERFASANRLIMTLRKKGLKSAAALLAKGETDRIEADIIAKLNELGDAENILLQQKQNAAEFHNGIAKTTLAIIYTIAFILLAGTLSSLRRETMQRKQKEQRLQTFFDTKAVGIVVIDQKGLIEEFNPASELLFGYTRQAVRGCNVNILMPEPYHHQHDDYLNNYFTSGIRKIGIGRQVVGKRLDGSIFPIEISVEEVNVKGQRVFIAFINDISMRKKLEAEAKQYEAIIQSSDDAIISNDLEGTIISWNAGAEAMFDYSADEMIGKPMEIILPPDRQDEENIILDKIKRGEKVVRVETTRLCKNGKIIHVSTTISPIRDTQGKVTGASKITRDMTERKQFEESIKMAKMDAERANKAKSEFLANMSHEIRTPMNAIIGLSDLALDMELPEKRQDYMKKINSASKVLLTILNDILDYSKVEAGRLKLESQPFYLEEVLQSAANLFLISAESKDLELVLDIPPDIPQQLRGDALRLGQVIGNLVGNSVKFTASGKVRIGVERLNLDPAFAKLRFEVADTGIGMTQTQIANLFHPFTQADGSITRRFGGTGLGLSISKKLIEAMEGEIVVASEPGKGSLFSFIIQLPIETNEPDKFPNHAFSGMRALVVDDLQDSRHVLGRQLEAWGMQVNQAGSGPEALNIIARQAEQNLEFDIILLDWKMPEMNGLKVLMALEERVQTGFAAHKPKIILLTGHNQGNRPYDAKHLNIDGILTKPVMPLYLFNSIAQIMGEHIPIPPLAVRPNLLALSHPIKDARLLLVEDNALNQQVAQELLERLGLRVTLAGNGLECLEALAQNEFDAVLMDLQMPELDGFETTRRIRLDERYQDLPIIAMTAAVMPKDRAECLAAGMNDHVAKPIVATDLIAALLKWIAPGSLQTIALSPAEESGQALCDQCQWPQAKLQYQELQRLLENHERVPQKLLNRLRNCLNCPPLYNNLDTLERQVQEYDYEGALATLRALFCRQGHDLTGSTGGLNAS